MGTGIPKIGHSFLVLGWSQDPDETVSQVHLFNILNGKLQDNIIGVGSVWAFPLVANT